MRKILSTLLIATLFCTCSKGENKTLPSNEAVEHLQKTYSTKDRSSLLQALTELKNGGTAAKDAAREILELKGVLWLGPEDADLLKDIHSLLESKDKRDKRAALQLLAYIHHDSSLPYIEKYIKDQNSELREWSVFAAGKYQNPKLKTLIIEKLNDQAYMVKRRAVQALENYADDKDVQDKLFELLKDASLNYDASIILSRKGLIK